MVWTIHYGENFLPRYNLIHLNEELALYTQLINHSVQEFG